MSLQALISEVKELADECVMKYGVTCVEVSDALLIAYLVVSLPEEHLDLFHSHKTEMLRIFRERAKKHIEWLNSE
jgi:hypothetical protein